MEKWRLIDLGRAEPLMAQTFYEAVASEVERGRSPSTVLLVQPSKPYVCLGFHQQLEKEVDVDYCLKENLPIIRRSQGGGATYLDGDQVFYQVVARRESEVIPASVEGLFEKLLAVTVYVYRSLGLSAEYKALNDVVVRGRKVSGNGAGLFGDRTVILVGNIILDLDYASMARVLKVPSEKFRDKMVKSMEEWVTSLRKELGEAPPAEDVKRLLAEGYTQTLGVELEASEPTEAERTIWENEVKPRHLSREWLYMPEQGHEALATGRAVKVAGGVRLVEVEHKARKLIRVRAELVGETINDILLSGDFFMLPERALKRLESRLKHVRLNREEVLTAICEFYEESGVATPGILPEDFAEAVMKIRDLT
ncbi:MAG: hypothetical protein QW057_03355 [Candidatus Bathyarchaeia archaeon]